jgi:hypothetical protein
MTRQSLKLIINYLISITRIDNLLGDKVVWLSTLVIRNIKISVINTPRAVIILKIGNRE